MSFGVQIITFDFPQILRIKLLRYNTYRTNISICHPPNSLMISLISLSLPPPLPPSQHLSQYLRLSLVLIFEAMINQRQQSTFLLYVLYQYVSDLIPGLPENNVFQSSLRGAIHRVVSADCSCLPPLVGGGRGERVPPPAPNLTRPAR